MDWNAITQVIANLGFPIAAAAAMFYYVNKQSELHKEEINKLSEAVQNNTLAIVKLTERIGSDK